MNSWPWVVAACAATPIWIREPGGSFALDEECMRLFGHGFRSGSVSSIFDAFATPAPDGAEWYLHGVLVATHSEKRSAIIRLSGQPYEALANALEQRKGANLRLAAAKTAILDSASLAGNNRSPNAAALWRHAVQALADAHQAAATAQHVVDVFADAAVGILP